MRQIALRAYGSPKHDVGTGLEYLPCSGHPHQRTDPWTCHWMNGLQSSWSILEGFLEFLQFFAYDLCQRFAIY